MRVSHESAIEKINIAIHDRWFELEEIEFNEAERTLRIPFGSSKKRGGLISSLYSNARASRENQREILQIRSVDSFHLTDTQRVGSYDFNKLTYLPETRTIQIATGIPLDLYVVVSEVDIEVVGP